MSPAGAGVLIVDDEPDILSVVADFLSSMLPGWRFAKANDAGHALAMLEDFQPSLILSDYLMPGMNGVEFSRSVRAAGNQAPIVLMTAFADSGMEGEIRRLGLVQDFFAKPLDIDRLVKTVQRLGAIEPEAA